MSKLVFQSHCLPGYRRWLVQAPYLLLLGIFSWFTINYSQRFHCISFLHPSTPQLFFNHLIQSSFTLSLCLPSCSHSYPLQVYSQNLFYLNFSGRSMLSHLIIFMLVSHLAIGKQLCYRPKTISLLMNDIHGIQ